MKRRITKTVMASTPDDPIKSHDGMDVNPFSAVVESSGYGFKSEIAERNRESFDRGLENQRTTRRSRNDWER